MASAWVGYSHRLFDEAVRAIGKFGRLGCRGPDSRDAGRGKVGTQADGKILKQNVSVQHSTIRIRLRGNSPWPPFLSLRRLSPAKITAWPHTPPSPPPNIPSQPLLLCAESSPRPDGRDMSNSGRAKKKEFQIGLANPITRAVEKHRGPSTTCPRHLLIGQPLALVENPSHSGWLGGRAADEQ